MGEIDFMKDWNPRFYSLMILEMFIQKFCKFEFFLCFLRNICYICSIIFCALALKCVKEKKEFLCWNFSLEKEKINKNYK